MSGLLLDIIWTCFFIWFISYGLFLIIICGTWYDPGKQSVPWQRSEFGGLKVYLDLVWRNSSLHLIQTDKLIELELCYILKVVHHIVFWTEYYTVYAIRLIWYEYPFEPLTDISILMTDIGVEMWWWQVWNVGDSIYWNLGQHYTFSHYIGL